MSSSSILRTLGCGGTITWLALSGGKNNNNNNNNNNSNSKNNNTLKVEER